MIPFSDSDVLGRYNEPVTSGVPVMVDPEIVVELAVRDLMSATQSLAELSASQTNEPLVLRETNDIELAYTRLGRMLSQLRSRHAA